MNLRKGLNAWLKGMKELSPKQVVVSKIILTTVMLVGFVWAIGVLMFIKTWHFVVILVGAFGLQLISLFAFIKQYKTIDSYNESIAEQQQNLTKVLRELNKGGRIE